MRPHRKPPAASVLAVALLIAAGASTPLAGQTSLPTLETPPIVPPIPSEINKGGFRINSPKWRRKYNVHEAVVTLLQVYMAGREGLQWKESLGELTRLFGEEKDQHEAYYDELQQVPDFVSAHAYVTDIRDEIRLLLRLSRATTAALDADLWSDREEASELLGLVAEVKSAALRTVRYLPAIAGISEAPAGGESGPGTPGDDEPGGGNPSADGADPDEETMWATPIDRLRLLAAMADGLREVRRHAEYLHGRVAGVGIVREADRRDATLATGLYATP